MAITVTNNLTNIDQADSITGWSVVGSATKLTAEGDIVRDGTGSVGLKLSAGRGGVQYDNGTGVDLSTKGVVYVWFNTSSNMSDVANTGGITIRLGTTTTDWDEWQIQLGSDFAGGWQRLVVDPVNVTPNTTSGAGLTITNVRYFTIQADVTTSIMGNILNVWVDRIDALLASATGTHAIAVSGTVATTGSLFTEIRDNATNDSVGIVLQGSGVLQANGKIQLGASTGTNTLTSQEETIVFQNHPVGAGVFGLQFIGGTGADTHEWGQKITGQNIGSKGTKILSAGPRWEFNASDANIDNFKMYKCTFDLDNGVQLGDGTTSLGSVGDTVHMIDNVFTNGGQLCRDIGADTIIESGNQIAFNQDTVASVDMIDENDIDITKWNIIQSTGFINSPAVTSAIKTIDYDFNLFSKPYITVDANETWRNKNFVGTIAISTQNEYDFTSTTGNSVIHPYDIDITAKRGTTPIQNVYTWIGYTTTGGTATTDSINNTLPTQNQVTTDVNGFVTSEFDQNIYTEATATTLNESPKTDAFLLAYNYGDQPMFRILGTVTTPQDFRLAVITDSNISETDQATAITNGSGIVFDKDSTTPWAILFFTGGSGTMSAGDTVTGLTSGFTGIFRELVSGTLSGVGAILVENVTGTMTNGETLDATTGTWQGVSDQTANPQQEFDWAINCNNKTLQTTYDYLSARMAEVHANVISNGFDDWVRWCEDENQLPMQALGGNTYKTERNSRLGEGVILWNFSTGTINKFTDNAGGTFIPPASVAINVTTQSTSTGNNIPNVKVSLYADPVSSGDSPLDSGLTNSSGVFSSAQSLALPFNIQITARLRGLAPFTVISTIQSGTTTFDVTAPMGTDSTADRRE